MGSRCFVPLMKTTRRWVLLATTLAWVAWGILVSESAGTESAAAEIISEVIAIKYEKAEDIADVLTYLSSGGGANKDSVQRLMQRASILNRPNLGPMKLLTDARSNLLQISATRSDMETIKNIVSKLDAVLPQILIEGAVLTVRLPDTKDAGRQDPARQPPAPADHFLASAVLWFTNMVPASTVNAIVSRQDGFGYMAGLGDGFHSTVTALGSDYRVNILQKPRILTSSGLSATMSLAKVYFPRNYSCSTYPGPVIPSSWIEQLGEIEVTPSVRSDGLIGMEIQASANQVIKKIHITDVRDVPNTNSTRSRASAAVRNGDILMIGGAIISRKQRPSGIPVLKHIPLLGSLFRGACAGQVRDEIIVLFRPTLLPSPTAERVSH